MRNQTIAIIGAGNLGLAIFRGLHKSGLLEDKHLILTRRDPSGLSGITHPSVTITSDNKRAVQQADIIFFAVQPGQFEGVIREVKDVLDIKMHTIVSLVTALTITQIETLLEEPFPVIRAMPNTAISVMQSMTCIAHNQAGKSKVEQVLPLFQCVGKTLLIQEELMQAATVVGASGIAFWMRLIRANTQGGVQLGFDSDLAQQIVVQTCLGAATLLTHNDNSHPEQEIDKVTTPQGCTISGLNEMEHNGLSSAVIKGLLKSYERINKMKQGAETLNPKCV